MFMTEEGNLFHVQSLSRIKPRPAVSTFQLAKVRIIFLLKLSLALVFFWFGVLKLTGVSPVIDLLNHSLPMLAQSPYIELLGLAEMFIAVGLVVNKYSRYAATLMIMYLFGTLSLVWIAPRLIFAPAFPVLTMQGEFIAKNFVLISAGLVVLESQKN
jgi:putative oxidoreductase